MATLTIPLDPHTEDLLRELSRSEGEQVTHVAARLLARAVRGARPRPRYDAAAIRAANAPFAGEDEALAESGSSERACLLAEEDVA